MANLAALRAAVLCSLRKTWGRARVNIEIVLDDVTKPKKSNILNLTWPVTSSVTSRSNFTQCLCKIRGSQCDLYWFVASRRLTGRSGSDPAWLSVTWPHSSEPTQHRTGGQTGGRIPQFANFTYTRLVPYTVYRAIECRLNFGNRSSSLWDRRRGGGDTPPPKPNVLLARAQRDTS